MDSFLDTMAVLMDWGTLAQWEGWRGGGGSEIVEGAQGEGRQGREREGGRGSVSDSFT